MSITHRVLAVLALATVLYLSTEWGVRLSDSEAVQHNAGVSFSLGQSIDPALIQGLRLAAWVGVSLWLLRTVVLERVGAAAAVGFVAAGLSNVLESLVHGGVRDWISLGVVQANPADFVLVGSGVWMLFAVASRSYQS